MAATRFDMTVNGDGTGSKLLPVNLADVTYMSQALSTVSRRVSVYVEFYDAAGVPVTPTGGTVRIAGRPMGQLWLDAVNSPINAADVKATVATYTVPYMEGLVSRVSARFIGVTGAASASVAVYREDA